MTNPRIVLVEDNADDEALMVRALRKASIDIDLVVARDGEEALQLLFEPHEQPRVVFLDLNLPQMSGLDVLERVRAESWTRLVPVVLLSSSRREEDVARAYALGANAYVAKAVDFQRFTEDVRILGAMWVTSNVAADVSFELQASRSMTS